MSIGNAFAVVRDGRSANADCDGIDQIQRPVKRLRMLDVTGPVMKNLRPEMETALEVDIMILDYLAYQATKACLESRTGQRAGTTFSASLKSSLQLVDSFTPIFKERHQQYRPDGELRLRLLLLKMTTLFTQRYTSNPTTPDRAALQTLRDASRIRAAIWNGGSLDRPASTACQPPSLVDNASVERPRLEQNRVHVLQQLDIPAEDEDYEDAFYGSPSSVSLLDLLPIFMEVSAASTSNHGSGLTERWMCLACEFMLQACLEQYLVCGVKGPAVVDEAFAWGYEDREDILHRVWEGRGMTEINEMFEDDAYATEVEGWVSLKHEYARELLGCHVPAQASGAEIVNHDIAAYLEAVAARHPIAEFEISALKFLEALSISTSEPVLAQLERGSLEGMTKEETKDFLTRCGI